MDHVLVDDLINFKQRQLADILLLFREERGMEGDFTAACAAVVPLASPLALEILT